MTNKLTRESLESYRPFLLAQAKKLVLTNKLGIDPEDLVQEAMLEIIRSFSAGHYRYERSPESWLTVVIRNIFLDHVEKMGASKRSARIQSITESKDAISTPDRRMTEIERMESSEEQRKMLSQFNRMHAQGTLSDIQFEALVYKLRGMQFTQMEAVSGIAKDAWRMRLRRATEIIQKELELKSKKQLSTRQSLTSLKGKKPIYMPRKSKL